MFDARTGVGVRIGVAEAVAIVRGATRLTAIASVTPVATPPPLELRRPGAAWRVASPDGTTVYVGTSGEILAVRTALWRWHDFAWGLHILDLGEREDTHHPFLIGSAALAVLTVLSGAWLLIARFTRRRRRREVIWRSS